MNLQRRAWSKPAGLGRLWSLNGLATPTLEEIRQIEAGDYRPPPPTSYHPPRIGGYQFKFGGNGVMATPGTPVHWFSSRNIDGAGNSTLSNLDEIATWYNGGSLGLSATQAASEKRPIFHTVAESGKINDLPGVKFDGGDSLATAAHTALTQPYYVYALARIDVALAGNISDGIAAGSECRIGDQSGLTWFAYSGVVLQSGQNAVLDDWTMYGGKFDNSAGAVYIDGLVKNTGSTGPLTMTGVTLGNQYDQTPPSLQGFIVEHLVYQVTPGLTAVFDWFESIAGSLPQT